MKLQCGKIFFSVMLLAICNNNSLHSSNINRTLPHLNLGMYWDAAHLLNLVVKRYNIIDIDHNGTAGHLMQFPYQDYMVKSIANFGRIYLDGGNDCIKNVLRRGEAW